jgi:GNAT superfamily N-acetyltransferase
MRNDRLAAYHVSVLPRERFPELPPWLPDGFSFVDSVPRTVERELLRSEFERWRIPFLREFRGAREGSLVALASGDLIVGLAYVAADNEIGLPEYGQLHYPVLKPEFRGRGLYRALFAARLQRSANWGLPGVVVTTNREGLPELFERWGALRVGTWKPARGLTSRLRRRIQGQVADPQRSLARQARDALRNHGFPAPEGAATAPR